MSQVQDHRTSGRSSVAVVIPLLFETRAESSFDLILCVACSAATQHARLQKRGWSPAEIHQRMAAQWPVQKKMALSHYVLWTEDSLQWHEKQLDRILAHAQVG